MLTQSSNSNFFKWVRNHAQKTAKTGISAATGLGKRFHNDTMELNKRKPLYDLLKANDTHLTDIGISRDDVKLALELPLNINAGRWLEQKRARSKNQAISHPSP